MRPTGSHLRSQTLGVVLIQGPFRRVVPDVSPDGIQGRLTANDVIIEAGLPGEISEAGRPDTFGRDGFELAMIDPSELAWRRGRVDASRWGAERGVVAGGSSITTMP